MYVPDIMLSPRDITGKYIAGKYIAGKCGEAYTERSHDITGCLPQILPTIRVSNTYV
jgi:hypothetical protein